MAKKIVYQSVPEFNQETHYVLEREPIEHNDFIFIPLEVVEIIQTEDTPNDGGPVEPSVAGYENIPFDQRFQLIEQIQSDMLDLIAAMLEV